MTNGVQVGRSFFPRPAGRPKDLGDFYELWTGLFQSTILGRIPYVNVDVAHKAFPTPLSLIEIMGQLLKQSSNPDNRYRNPNAGSLSDQLQKHLKGLRIVYKMPERDGVISYKSYKFLALGQPPASEYFPVDGQRTSVLDYFANKGVQLRHPEYPCMKVGSAVNSIALPPEFCHVPAGQVSSLLDQILSSSKNETNYRALIKRLYIAGGEEEMYGEPNQRND